jgi:hypothetical protein
MDYYEGIINGMTCVQSGRMISEVCSGQEEWPVMYVH